MPSKKKVAEQWGIKGAEVAALLGVSSSTWDRMSAGTWEGALSQDQLTRISAIVGLFKGLHLLFADDMADRWVRLRNRGPLFENRTPIEAHINHDRTIRLVATARLRDPILLQLVAADEQFPYATPHPT